MTQWTYEVISGKLLHPDGVTVSSGLYSGHGEGLNNPALEDVHDVGPIPCGIWQIGPWHDHYEDKGPVVGELHPVGFDPHGRSGFLCHGDNSAMNHTASHGCIIAPRPVREAIRDSGVTKLIVVHG